MIYNEYFASNSDLKDIDIDISCIGEAGALETLIWAEEENRKFMEECFNCDFKELLDNSAFNESVGDWIKERFNKLIEFVKMLFDKAISILKNLGNSIKKFFSKEKAELDSYVMKLSEADQFQSYQKDTVKSFIGELAARAEKAVNELETVLQKYDSVSLGMMTKADLEKVTKSTSDTSADVTKIVNSYEGKLTKTVIEFTKKDADDRLNNGEQSREAKELYSFIDNTIGELGKKRQKMISDLKRLSTKLTRAQNQQAIITSAQTTISTALTVMIKELGKITSGILTEQSKRSILAKRHAKGSKGNEARQNIADKKKSIDDKSAKNESVDFEELAIEDELSFIDDEM